MNKIFTFLGICFLIVTVLLLWATRGEKNNDTVAVSGEEEVVEEQASTIGGAFTLTDQNAQQRTNEDFKGKVMLVFFGFTHCPDICPVTVSTFSSLMELLGDKADQVVPIFITVDPARDTPEVMKEYLSNFDKRIVGLSGTEEQITEVAKAYKAYFSVSKQSLPDEDGEELDEDDYPDPVSEEHAEHLAMGGDNYLVDHSGYIYLMNKDGNYVEHFRYDVSEQELADALKKHLE